MRHIILPILCILAVGVIVFISANGGQLYSLYADNPNQYPLLLRVDGNWLEKSVEASSKSLVDRSHFGNGSMRIEGYSIPGRKKLFEIVARPINEDGKRLLVSLPRIKMN